MSLLPACPSPVSQSERISVIDSLRGFAILGILLMNMTGFALPGVVGHDPSTLNEFGTINYYIWFFISWFVEGTQRALFSLLFGAGIILFVGRQENKLDGLLPADYFFRRQLWLIVLSLFDVFILLWNGDILLDYACLGMIMFAFRKLSPKTLLIASAICLLFMLARENRDFYQEKKMIAKGEAVAAIDTTQTKLTDNQKEALESMTAFRERSTQANKLKRMAKVNRKVQGNYASVYAYRTSQYIEDLVPYLYFELWDVLIFMFLGMAFFKLGFLTGTVSAKVYGWMTVWRIGARTYVILFQNAVHD